MNRLTKRLSALETNNATAFRPWHRVFLEDGQTEEEAIAAYEAENGPVGDDACWIIRFAL